MRHILDSITCVSHGINIFEISKLKYYEYRSYQPIIILLIILYFIRSASCFQYHLLWVLNLKTQKTSRPRWRWSPGRAPLGMSSPGRRTPWQRTPGGSTQLYWWSSSHTKQTKPFGEGFSHVVWAVMPWQAVYWCGLHCGCGRCILYFVIGCYCYMGGAS